MKFLWFLLVVVSVEAKVEWIFTQHPRPGKADALQLTSISIGSSNQLFSPFVNFDSNCIGLWLSGPFRGPNGFDMSASTSFRQSKTVYNSILGQESMTIKSPTNSDQTLQRVEFNVIDREGYCADDFVSLSFAHQTGLLQNTFLNSVFASSSEDVVVFAYDNTPIEQQQANGTLTIGAKSDLCATGTHVSVVDPVDNRYPQWNVKVDRISAGKFAASQPGTAAFELVDSVFELSSDAYDQIANVFNIDSNGQMPCETTGDITFTIGGGTLTIGSDNYMGKDRWTGNCFFRGKKSRTNQFFTVSYAFLRNRCLLFDYQNVKIGFGNRK